MKNDDLDKIQSRIKSALALLLTFRDPLKRIFNGKKILTLHHDLSNLFQILMSEVELSSKQNKSLNDELEITCEMLEGIGRLLSLQNNNESKQDLEKQLYEATRIFSS